MSTNTMHDHPTEFVNDGPCPACGFQPDRVPPTDIAVALRSFARRFRGVLSPVDDVDARRMSEAPTSGEWSALEHAGHVRDVLHALDLRLQRVLREDNPALAATPDTPPTRGVAADIATVIAELDANAKHLAATVERVQGKEWDRTGQRDRASVTALDIAREAVHEGSHHLRSAQHALDAARAS